MDSSTPVDQASRAGGAPAPGRTRDREEGHRILVPREHGAWAMWLAPFLITAIATGRAPAPLWVLVTAVFLLFWSRYPLWVWAHTPRRGFPRSALLSTGLAGAGGAALGLWLAVGWGYPWLVPLALGGLLVMAGHLAMASRGLDRSLVSELLGIGGLTLTGPAAYYVATGHLDSTAWTIWGLSVLFFGVSVFYVKMKVDGHRHRKAGVSPPPAVFLLAAYVVLATAAVAALASVGAVPWRILWAYAPVVAQASLGAGTWSAPLRLRRLGLTWMGHSVAFGALAGLLLR